MLPGSLEGGGGGGGGGGEEGNKPPPRDSIERRDSEKKPQDLFSLLKIQF